MLLLISLLISSRIGIWRHKFENLHLVSAYRCFSLKMQIEAHVDFIEFISVVETCCGVGLKIM